MDGRRVSQEANWPPQHVQPAGLLPCRLQLLTSLGSAKCRRSKLRNLFGVLGNVLITHMPRQRRSQERGSSQKHPKLQERRNV